MTADTARAPASELFLAELRAVIGDRLSTAAAVRDHHASGEDYLPPAAPDAVYGMRPTPSGSNALLKTKPTVAQISR